MGLVRPHIRAQRVLADTLELQAFRARQTQSPSQEVFASLGSG